MGLNKSKSNQDLQLNPENDDFSFKLIYFKPSDLLLPCHSSLNTIKHLDCRHKIDSKRPFVLYLPRISLNNSPKIANINYEIFCKKKIKYLNYYVTTHLHNSSFDNNPQFKLHQSMKNLRRCKDLYFYNDYQPSLTKEIPKLRRSTKGFIKTLKSAETIGPFNNLIKDSTIRSLGIDVQHMKSLRPSLKTMRLKWIFQYGMSTKKALKRVSRMDRLERLEIEIADYRKIIKTQEEFSIILKRFSQLKELDLGLRFMMEREDLFDKGEQSAREIDVDLLLWRKITGLHISDDEIPLERVMNYVGDFQALREFSYYGEPKLREDFTSFQSLRELPCLRKVYLSIAMLVAFGSTSKSFFEVEFLPPSVEEFSLLIEIQRIPGIIDKATESGVLFENLKKLSVLRYFLLSISVEGHISSNKQDCNILPLFFRRTVESLCLNLNEFFVMISGPQKLFSIEDKHDAAEGSLMDLVYQRLPNLKNLYLKFLSINMSLINSANGILQKIQSLSIEGPLPLVLIQKLGGGETLELLDCRINVRVTFEKLVEFLRGVSRFKNIQTLNITANIRHQEGLMKLDKDLFCAIVDLFRNFERIHDLSLKISKVRIGSEVARYFLELCTFKKILRFAQLEFENCEILKEYFTSSISEGACFSDEEDEDEDA